jgi:hypothetical protein
MSGRCTGVNPVASNSAKDAGVEASVGRIGFDYTCTICSKFVKTNTFHLHKNWKREKSS